MFTGLTQDAFDFLWDLMFHNEKAWFEENRARFETALHMPFRALAEETVARVKEKVPNGEWHLHLSRIYRDARRPSPMGPYRNHLWFSLRNGREEAYAPSLWFEVGAQRCGMGMGFYQVSPEQLAAYRRRIDQNPTVFEEMARTVLARGYTSDAQTYRRQKAERGEFLNPWYNSRRPGVERLCPPDERILSPRLPEFLTEEFLALMPLYEFLRACGPSEKAR